MLAFKCGRVKRLPDEQLVDENDAKIEIYHHIAVGDMVNEYHTNLDGCGYIISRAETVEKAGKAAARVLEKISESIF